MPFRRPSSRMSLRIVVVDLGFAATEKKKLSSEYAQAPSSNGAAPNEVRTREPYSTPMILPFAA